MSRPIGRATTLPKSVAIALLAALSTLTACDTPAFRGPQLQAPPDGFILRPTARAERSMFAHLPELHHDAWVQPQPPYSAIYINGYAGTLTLDDVLAAQDSARTHATNAQIQFGAVEPLRIDDREAWAWEERGPGSAGSRLLAYRVMVPYDTISYAVEVSTEDPALTAGAPESLRTVVSTFAVGEVVYDWPLIAVGAGLLALLLYVLWQRSRADAERLQSMRLVQVRHGDEEEGAEPVRAGDPSRGTSD